VLAVCSSPCHALWGRGELAREKKPKRGLSRAAADGPAAQRAMRVMRMYKHTTALMGSLRVSLTTAANPRERTLVSGALRRAV
jgi:hypothetical protein